MGSRTLSENGLAVVEAPVEGLTPHPRNPRTISPGRLEQLKRTLEAERDMLRARPLVALPDGTVIAGNQRLMAARELGWETLPVVYADLDEERATRWMLLDNRSFGEDDASLAAELLAELHQAGSELELTGYSSADVDRMLREFKMRNRDPDEAPPLPKTEPRSKRGEVYEVGEHRIMCGDATSESDVAQLIESAMPELMWTDPPYGVEYVGKTADALTIEGDTPSGLRELLTGAFRAADPVCVTGMRFYVCAPAGPRGTDFRLALTAAGWTFHQALVWVKNSMVLGHSDHHFQHEDVLYGWKPGQGRVGRGKHQGTRWYGDNSQTSVFTVDRPSRSREHPTMKPVALITANLLNSSRPGDTVYDPFAGSGSTLIAAEQTGRRCFAMEIDPGYCDVIRDRYEAFVAD